MSRGRAATGPVLLAALMLGLPSVATAQFNRVFASARTGNDGNSCNNINTPCQTLQGAVNQVAAGGSVLVLDTGGYGPVTIGKALTIEAPAGIEAFIHPPSGSAISILAGASDVVVLRGLTLSGGDFGVDYVTGGAVHVERCVIQGFAWDGIVASRLLGPAVFGDLYVEDTIVRNCGFIGISASTTNGLIRATIERCHLAGNPGFGLGGDENSRTAAWKTVSAGNFVGISLFARHFHSSEMFIEQCTADNNVVGIQVQGDIFDSPATLWVSDSTATGNAAGIKNLGTSFYLSRVNNTVEGNAQDTTGSISTYSAK